MQREVRLICGQTGSGKTHFAREIVKSLPRCLVIDSGFQEFENTIFFDNIESLISSLKDRSAETDKEARFNLGYTPLPYEYESMFDIAIACGNLTLVLEEADRFDEKIFSYQDIITRGRHYGISILAIAPHPYNFPKDLRRQLTEVISFRQTEESDLDYLSDVIGEEIYQVRDFPRDSFKYLKWTPETGVKIYANS